MKTCRSAGWLLLVFLGAGHIQTISAAEANPPPPRITSTVTSNGQARFAFPYPAAERYEVFGASIVTGPFTTNVPGALVGPTFTPATNAGPLGFYRVAVTPMSSNALFAATVLHRVTYGPSPDDIDHIASVGPEQFIQEQLNPEAIAETIDVDPPIINTPPPVPPAPPLTNWIRRSVTGTASGVNFGIYLSSAGRVYLDDVRLVLGTNADVGANLLLNGDFEDTALFPPWIRGSAISTATLVTNSPTVDGLAASGTNCLLLVASSGTTTLSSGFYQPFATNAPPTNEKYTLSFSYLPIQNQGTNVMTVRLSGTLASTTGTLPTAPVAPPTPPVAPPAVSPVYAKLTNVLATLEDLRAWHVLHAVRSKRQLHEVLAQFFDNHFCTQYQKTEDWFDMNFSNAITNDTDRKRLSLDFDWREHNLWRQVLLDPNGTFYDLLKISIESPAMIIYLDTVINSRAAANENYAREILELHTFGVDNGYVQQDIVELAKVWTGWRVAKKDISVANNPHAPPVNNVTNDPGVWVLHFATNNHSYATKRLFTNVVIDARFGPPYGGQAYSLVFTNNQFPGTNGMLEGYRVIEHLANNPHTAEFLCVKLCRLFIHEKFEFGLNVDYRTPATAEIQLVKDCMAAWDVPASGDGRKGNIRQVLSVIFNSALFRGHAASHQKVKTPLELAVSAIRALRVSDTDTNGYFTTTCDTDGYGVTGNNNTTTSPLSRMGGMGLFNKAEPDGYSEFGSLWLNTANLCERMRFVQHLLMPASSSTKDDDYTSVGIKNTSDPAKLVRLKLPSASWNDAAAVTDFFLGILYPGEGRGNLGLDRQAAITYLTTDDAGNASAFNLVTHDGRLRSMVALLMSMPRFQEQ